MLTHQELMSSTLVTHWGRTYFCPTAILSRPIKVLLSSLVWYLCLIPSLFYLLIQCNNKCRRVKRRSQMPSHHTYSMENSCNDQAGEGSYWTLCNRASYSYCTNGSRMDWSMSWTSVILCKISCTEPNPSQVALIEQKLRVCAYQGYGPCLHVAFSLHWRI